MNKYFYRCYQYLLFVCFVVAAPAVTGQNKVLDGSFEDATPFTDPADIARQYQTFTTTKSMTYWQVTANTVDKNNKAYLSMGCPPGGQDYNIDLNPFGAISQMLRGLVPGTKYAFSFYTRAHYYISTSCPATGAATMQVDVGAGGVLLTDILVLSKADMGWAKRSYEFVATADTALLSFTGTGSCTGSGGVLIDKVEVIASGTDPCVPYVHFAHAGRDTGFCMINGAAAVTLSASGGVSYAWSPASLFTDPNLATAIATITKTTTFIVTVTNEYGCLDKDTVLATVYPSPVVKVSTKEVKGCSSTTVQLAASGAEQYLWSPVSGLDAAKSPDPILTLNGIAQYVVTGTNSYGCTSRDTVYAVTYPVPDVQITADQTDLDCFHNSAELSATGAQSYTWEPALYCEAPSKAVTRVRPPATTVFTLTGISDQGCSGTDTILVSLKGESTVRMPNAFTPNGDRLNDEAKPVVYCDFILRDFSIYNRAGKRLFQTTDAQKGWDGTFQGTPCDGNVYFYMIRGTNSNGAEFTAKGDITLIR